MHLHDYRAVDSWKRPEAALEDIEKALKAGDRDSALQAARALAQVQYNDGWDEGHHCATYDED